MQLLLRPIFDGDRQWHDTQCLSCGAWSPHEQWYFDEPEEGAPP